MCYTLHITYILLLIEHTKYAPIRHTHRHHVEHAQQENIHRTYTNTKKNI